MEQKHLPILLEMYKEYDNHPLLYNNVEFRKYLDKHKKLSMLMANYDIHLDNVVESMIADKTIQKIDSVSSAVFQK